MVLILLIGLQASGYYLSYIILSLYLTELSGNVFVNAIIFGMTRAIAIFIFGGIMSCMSDMAVMRIVFVGVAISHILLIFF